MNCRIRPALPEDIPIVGTLFREYQAHLNTDICFQTFEHELSGLPGDYAPPRGAILLAEVDGQVAGVGALRALDPYTAEMKRVFVRPAFQGRGLGRDMAEGLIEVAASRGYSKVRLDTLPTLDAAIALYRKLGFLEIDRYNDNPVPGVLFFELDLATYPRLS